MTSATPSSTEVINRKTNFTFDRIVALVLAVAFLIIGGRSLVKSLSTENASPSSPIVTSGSSARQAFVKALNRYRITLGPDSRRILTDYLATNPNLNEIISGETLLDIATECGYSNIVANLLRQGANPNLHGEGWPPLYTACNQDKYVIAAELIKGGAQVDESNGRGITPLLTATYRPRDPDLVKLLISAGANVNLPAPDGETPLDFALQSKDPEGKIIAGLIQAAGGRTHKYEGRR